MIDFKFESVPPKTWYSEYLYQVSKGSLIKNLVLGVLLSTVPGTSTSTRYCTHSTIYDNSDQRAG